MYPFALALPRLGRSGEPSGTSERTAPCEALPMSALSSTHAYGKRLSTRRSFVCGPAARRKIDKSLNRLT